MRDPCDVSLDPCLYHGDGKSGYPELGARLARRRHDASREPAVPRSKTSAKQGFGTIVLSVRVRPLGTFCGPEVVPVALVLLTVILCLALVF